MLVGGGPWLGVLGGVFTDKVIVQRLTDFMWCAHSTTEEDPRVYRLARVLVALRRSIHELENFYRDISDPKTPPLTPGHTHPRFYALIQLRSLKMAKLSNSNTLEYSRKMPRVSPSRQKFLTQSAKTLRISWSSL